MASRSKHPIDEQDRFGQSAICNVSKLEQCHLYSVAMFKHNRFLDFIMDELLSIPAKKGLLPAILMASVLLGAIAGVYILSSDSESPTSNPDPIDEVEQNGGDGDTTTNETSGNMTTGGGNSTGPDDGSSEGSGDNETDDGHDHGGGEEPIEPPFDPDEPVEIPDVTPTLNPTGSGTLAIDPFTHLPTNTSIDLDLQTGGSEVSASPSLPSGLSVDANGHLVGNLSTPFRNQRVNLTHNGSTFEVAFTAYDLNSDYNELTSIEASTVSPTAGAVIIPITEPGLAFALDKESAPQIGATYAYGSKVVAAGGSSILSPEMRHPIFDSSIEWACGPATSVHVILDSENNEYRASLEQLLTDIGYTVSSDFATSECMVAIGGGAITYPDNLSHWLTHERGAVVMGTNSFIQSVNHGELFVAAGETVFNLNLDEESYSPMRNGYTALHELFLNYDEVYSGSPAIGTVKGLFQLDREREYMYNGSGYGDRFMGILGGLVTDYDWPVHRAELPTFRTAKLDAIHVAKTGYVQNMPSDAGYVDVNAASYPGLGNATLGTHTHVLDLMNTDIDDGRGSENYACAIQRINQITPLWANAGDEIVVRVPSAMVNQRIIVTIGAHCENTFHGSYDFPGFARDPGIATSRHIDSEEIRLTSAYGGLIVFQYPEAITLGDQTVTVENVSRAPHYVLGQTTTEEWAQQRQIDNPWAVFEGEHIVLSVPTSYVADWENPNASFGMIDNATGWLEWFHGVDDTYTRKAIWVPDVAMNQNPTAFMIGADPIPSKQVDILPYLTDDAANTSLHWVLLHEMTHVLEPASMPKLSESWADLVPAAYYKMVRDTEIWETNKNTSTVAAFQFFVDDYLAAGADYQNATATGFGNYAGSAGYALLWFIGDEFGFDVYREGIINIANGTAVYDWDNWGVQLCTATGSNIATIFDIYNIPLAAASVDHCGQYPEWVDHPFVDTGSASGSGDKDE
ncbi:MAG: hypothetical protein DWC07_06080 [Candidatus Poseidoniales archaeon]|nr:MAG: hypothetical protein DWC07_06080 [Candidatus Poseidoniales archaeon]